MAKVQAVASKLREGAARRPPAGPFDLAGLKAAVEEAVCRAWEEEAARKREGDAGMDKGIEQELKPAEKEPQQASLATDRAPVASNGSTSLDVCQEAVAKVLAVVEERTVAAYQAALGEAEALEKETSHIQERIAGVEAELAMATSKVQEQAEADEAAICEAGAKVRAALAPYVAAGVVTPKEAEEHLEGAFRKMGEQLQAQRQEARARLEALRAEIENLKARLAELDSRRAALEARLAQLRDLPCIVSLERARQEELARREQAVRQAIHFLEIAPWHELSWQRKLTARLEEAVALATEDPTVFEALVERLGRELERVDATGRPGLGWSVVRAIEALELARLFPNLEAKKSDLVQAARRYHRERQSGPPLTDKIVSLASRWGARVASG